MSTNKPTAPTAERKQTLETCVHKLEEINTTVLNLQPRLKTNTSSSKYNEAEVLANACIYSIHLAFNDLAEMCLSAIRKEVQHV